MNNSFTGLKTGSALSWPALVIFAGVLTIGWADTWEGIKQEAANIHTVKSDFIQEKHLKILRKPLISKGSFYFRAPGSLRWEYASPVRSVLLMHDGKSRRYVLKDGKMVEDAAANLQAMQIVLREIVQWLHGRFDANPDFSASLEPGPRIVLTPAVPALAEMIAKIELNLSEEPGLIKSVVIHEGKDAVTRLQFIEPGLNEPIDTSVFTSID